MRKCTSLFVLMCTIVFVTVTPSMADLLFTNPSDGATTAMVISSTSLSDAEYDDFNLKSNSYVNSISFHSWISEGDTLSSVQWAIYSNAGSNPGTQLYSGTSSITSSTYLRTYEDEDEDVYSFSVGSLSLTSGVYWLTLFDAIIPNHKYDWAGWELTSGAYNNAHTEEGVIDADFVFDVDGTAAPPSSVPEPSTILLLGSGLIGLAGLWRKFKK